MFRRGNPFGVRVALVRCKWIAAGAAHLRDDGGALAIRDDKKYLPLPDKILNVDCSQGKIVNSLDDALTIGCARRFKKAFGASFFDQFALVH